MSRNYEVDNNQSSGVTEIIDINIDGNRDNDINNWTALCPRLPKPLDNDSNIETADLCMGWFWGPDEIFSEDLEGVIDVTVGYSGGIKPYPTYNNMKDHTEAIRIEYDKNILSYEEILDTYMEICANNYTKPCKYIQYRACILYHNKQQQILALKMLEKYEKIIGKTIHIAIEVATEFYRAEEYHQKYYLKH